MSGPVQKQNGSQRIRGPRLEVFRKDVTFDEAVRIADAENRVLPSNKRIDQEIMEDGKFKKLLTNCLTGTLIACAAKGNPLGKNIVYFDSSTHHRWIFPVPEDLQGNTDCVLITEHPHYRIEIDRNDLIIHTSYLTMLGGFPKEDGGYRTDPRHCIPLGEKVGPDDPEIRYLTGRHGSERIVPINRGSATGNKKHIFLFAPSQILDMVVEVPAEEIKEPVPEPAQGSVYKTLLPDRERNPLYERMFSGRLGSMQRMISSNSDPAFILSIVIPDVKVTIDLIVDAYKTAKSAGWDTRPLVQASKELGEFVTIQLASDPRFNHLVPELKRYLIQKMQELKEVSK